MEWMGAPRSQPWPYRAARYMERSVPVHISGLGTVFKLNTDGTGFTNLYEFHDGQWRHSACGGIASMGNTLYGTTQHTSGGAGELIQTGTDGSNFTVLANGSDGAQPQGGLVLSGDSFYGTTSAGGTPGAGIVFKVGTNGTGFAMLHTFSAATNESVPADNSYANSDGASPLGTLAVSGDVLYGTTDFGGTFGVGTIFRLNTDGTGFTNLYNFTNGVDGSYPQAGMALAGNTLYGTTSGSLPFPNEVEAKYVINLQDQHRRQRVYQSLRFHPLEL